jgi:hypothetical protein
VHTFCHIGADIDIDHCSFLFESGEVTIIPGKESPCSVNGNLITEPLKLSQGAVILLGQANMFRFNHPAQAAKLREEYKGVSEECIHVFFCIESKDQIAIIITLLFVFYFCCKKNFEMNRT